MAAAMPIGQSERASMLLLTCQARARGFKIAGSGERAGQAELACVDGGRKWARLAWTGPEALDDR